MLKYNILFPNLLFDKKMALLNRISVQIRKQFYTYVIVKGFSLFDYFEGLDSV